MPPPPDSTIRPHPPPPTRTFHLVLCVVFSPLRDIRIFPPRIRPSRGRPRLCLGDIPPVLAQPHPQFLATHPRYRGCFIGRHLSVVLRVPIRPRTHHTNLHCPNRNRGVVLRNKPVLFSTWAHLAVNLYTRRHPHRR
jgi:hypothetical protein